MWCRARRSRCRRTKNSNPDHQVELHPVLRIGNLDFLGHLKWIRDGRKAYKGFGPPKLKKLIAKELTVQRIRVQGEGYVRIRGAKQCCNRWFMRAKVAERPRAIEDGVVVRAGLPSSARVMRR